MPGVDGEAMAPMMASVASVAFTSSDSNQRSRMVRAGAVRISTARGPVRAQLQEAPAGAGEAQEVAGAARRRGRAASRASVGSMARAIRSSMAS